MNEKQVIDPDTRDRAEAERKYARELAKEIEIFERRWENTNLSAEKIAAVKRLYALYGEETMLWYARLWDPVTGGFYYSNSARDTEGFLPDIEDTAFAFANLLGGFKIFQSRQDFLDRLSFWGLNNVDTRIVNWIESLRAPDGFYYHPQWGNRVDDTGLFRHHNCASSLLRGFGALAETDPKTESVPKKPTNLPAYLESKEAVIAWLDSFNWSRNQTYHSASVVGVMYDTLAEIGLIDTVIDYFDKKFEIYGNGTFESEIDMMSLNGTMKVTDLYLTASRTFPCFEKVLEATVKVLVGDEPTPILICSIANPFRNLTALKRMANREIETAEAALQKATEENRLTLTEALQRARARLTYLNETIDRNAVAIIEKTTERLSAYRRSDGAFSLRATGCGAETCGVQWGYRIAESDVNGTNQAIGVIISAIFYSVLDEPPVAVWSPETREKFIRILLSAKPAEKKAVGDVKQSVSLDGLTVEALPSKNVSTLNGRTKILRDEKGIGYLSHESRCDEESRISFNLLSTVKHSYYEYDFSLQLDCKDAVASLNIVGSWRIRLSTGEACKAEILKEPTRGGMELRLPKDTPYSFRFHAARRDGNLRQIIVEFTSEAGDDTLTRVFEDRFGRISPFPITAAEFNFDASTEGRVCLKHLTAGATLTVPHDFPFSQVCDNDSL